MQGTPLQTCKRRSQQKDKLKVPLKCQLLGTLTWTCPSGTMVYPMIYGLDLQDCAGGDYFARGFDIDSNGNILTSGYVVSNSTTGCPYLTNSQQGSFAFLAYQNFNGGSNTVIAQWPMFISNSGTMYAFSVIQTSTDWRVQLVTVSTGAVYSEKQLAFTDTTTYTAPGIITMQAIQDSSSIYIFMNGCSSMFSAQTGCASGVVHGYIIKLDYSLNLIYHIAKKGTGAAPNGNFQFGSATLSTSYIWTTSYYDNGSSGTSNIYQWVQLFNIADGSDYKIIGWPVNTSAVNWMNQISLSPDQSIWAALSYQVANGQFPQITYGNTATLSLTANRVMGSAAAYATWFTLNVISNTQLLMWYVQCKIPFNNQIATNYVPWLQLINYVSNTVTYQWILTQPNPQTLSMQVFTKLSGSTLYTFTHSKGYLNATEGQRVIFIFILQGYLVRFSTASQSFPSDQCYSAPGVNYGSGYTSTTQTSITSWTTTNALNYATTESTLIDTTSTPTLSSITASMSVIYVMQDSTYNKQCALPYTTSPTWITYDANTQLTQSISYGPVTVTQCDGRMYTLNQTNVVNYAGTVYSTGTFNFVNSTQMLYMSFQATDYLSYVGVTDLRFFAYINHFQLYFYIKAQLIQNNAYVKDPTNPVTTITGCSKKVYPLCFGAGMHLNSWSGHWAYYVTQDPYGNFLHAGQGTYAPFGGNYINAPYIGLTDQRGNSYWVYSMMYANTTNLSIQKCNYVNYYSGYVYGLCRMGSYFYGGSMQSILVKLNYTTGQMIYMKSVPSDTVNPTNQQGYLFSGLQSSTLALAVFQVSYGIYHDLALMKFDESTFSINYWMYNSGSNACGTGTLAIGGALMDQTNGFLYTMRQQSNYGTRLIKYDIATLTPQIIWEAKDANFGGGQYTQMIWFSTDRILIPTVDYSQKKYCLYTVYWGNFSTANSFCYQLATGNTVQQAVVTTDTSNNVYWVMGDSIVFLCKFDPSLNWLNCLNFFSNSTQRYYNAWPSGIFYYAPTDEIFFSVPMFWMSGQEFDQSSVFWRAYSNLDMSQYNFFQFQTFTLSTYLTSITPLVPVVGTLANNTVNVPYYSYFNYKDTSVLRDMWGTLVNTYSYSNQANQRAYTGLGAFGGHSFPPPMQNYSWFSDDLPMTFLDPTSYEFVANTGIKQIKFTIPPASCLGGVNTITAVNQYTNQTGTTQFGAFTWYTNGTLNINTVSYGWTAPQVIRYANQLYNYNQYNNYIDFLIQIRVVAATNYTLVTPAGASPDKCYMNPFPASIKNDITTTSSEILMNALYVNPNDENLIIGGQANVNSWLANSDYSDGFIMRVGNTLFVEWASTYYGCGGSIVVEQVAAVCMVNNTVYGTTVRLPGYDYFSLMKLTYAEGKMIWAKTVNLINGYDAYVMQYTAAGDLASVNPLTSGIFGVTFRTKASVGYVPTFVLLNDTYTDLLVINQIQIKQLSTTIAGASGPLIYVNSSTFYWANFAAVTVSTMDQLQLFSINAVTGAINWSLYIQETSDFYYYEIGPSVAYNYLNNMVYMAAIHNPNIISLHKAYSNGTYSSGVQLTMISTVTVFTVGLGINDGNGHLCLVSLVIGQVYQVIYLDQNFVLEQMTYGYSWNAARATNRWYSQANGNLFISFNSNAFFASGSIQETVLAKQSLNYWEVAKYNCMEGSQSTSYPTVSTITPTTGTVPSTLITITTGVVTYNNPYTASFQKGYPYGTGNQLYSHGANAISGNSQYMSLSCDFAGFQIPAYSYLPPLEVVQGNTASVTLTTSMFTNCQGIAFTIGQILDETGSATRSSTNSYLTVSGNTITIDATNTPPYPSFRVITVSISVTLYAINKSVQVPMLVIVTPDEYVNATQTAAVSTCPSGTMNYPKVLSYTTTGSTYAQYADLDATNGNVLQCGLVTSSLPYYQPQQYYQVGGGQYPFVILSNTVGEVQWAYSYSNLQGTTYFNAFSYFCMFGLEGNTTYSLIGMETSASSSTGLRMAFIKQDYATGVPEYLSTLPGTYFSNQINYIVTGAMAQDPSSHKIYLSIIRTDIAAAVSSVFGHYLARIDASTDPPIYEWVMYAQDTYTNSQFTIDAITFSPTGNYFYTFSWYSQYGSPYYAYYPCVSQFNITTAKANTAIVGYYNQNTGYDFQDRISACQDQTTGYIYYSYNTNYQSGDVYHYIYKYSDSGLPVTGYVATIGTQTGNSYKHEGQLMCNNTYIYEVFTNTDSYLYFAKYNSALTSATFLQFNAASLTSTQTCFGFNGISFTYNSASVSYSNQIASRTYVLHQVYTKMLPFLKIYAELVNYSNQMYYSYASWIGGTCTQAAPTFQTPLSNQQITAPASSIIPVSISRPVQCQGLPIAGTMKVDKYSTVPSFISFQDSATSPVLLLNPQLSDVGTYTVRITYTIVGSSINSQATFLLDVLPNDTSSYVATCTNTSCGYLYPIFLGSNTTITNYQPFIGDVDSTASTFLACGRSLSINVMQTAYYSSWFASLAPNFNPNYYYTIDHGQYGSQPVACLFGEGNYIYIALNVGTQTTSLDTAAIYKYTKQGVLYNATQIQPSSSFGYADYFFVNTSTGDIWMTMRTQTSAYEYSGYQSFFVFHLDKAFNYLMGKYSNFGYSTSGLNMVFDYSTSTYYQVFQNNQGLNSVICFGIVRASMLNTTIYWSKALYNPTYFTAQFNFQNGDIFILNNYVYAGFAYWNFIGSVNGYEGFISKWNNAGTLAEEMEFQLRSQPSSFEMIYSTSNNLIIVGVGYVTGYQDILLFVPGSTMSCTSNFMSQYLSGYNAQGLRLVDLGGTIYGFFSGKSSNQGLLIVDKITNITSQNWDRNCSASVMTVVSTSTENCPTGIYGSQSSLWQTSAWSYSNTVTAAQFAVMNTNVQYANIKPFTNSSKEIKQDYGGYCSSWSSPSPPTVSNRTGTPGVNTGGFSVGSNNYSYQMPFFTQCQGVVLSVDAMLSPSTTLPSWIVFNNNASQPMFFIAPSLNSLIGNYTLRYQAYFVTASGMTISNYSDFVIQIIANTPPTVITDFNTTTEIYAWHNQSWTIYLNNDVEGDQAIFNAVLLNATTNASISATWFTVTYSDSSEISFSVTQPPQPANGIQTNYTIQVQAWDQFNVATPNLYNITLEVNYNHAPVMTQTINETLATFRLPNSFTYTFWYQNFTDQEGDSVIINCPTITTTGADSNWISITYNATKAGNITFSGTTPRNNSYNGTYIIECLAKDQYDGTPLSFDFTMSVLPKLDPTVPSSPGDQSFRIPAFFVIVMDDYYFDPQGCPLEDTLYVNGTLYTGQDDPWLTYDNTTTNLTCIPTANSQQGNHSIALQLWDGITTPQWINFTIEVIPDYPLQALMVLDPIYAITGNQFTFSYNQSLLFLNPENLTFSMYLRIQGVNILPYFITSNFSNGTFSGFVTDSDVGTYDLEWVGVDDWPEQLTLIALTLIIKPCYYNCQKCWDSSYNTCTMCKTNYYLFGPECIGSCLSGYYNNQVNWTCSACPKGCSVCNGSDSTQNCQRCSLNYFSLGSGCYSSCPKGYWNDFTDNSCQPCSPLCTQCYGALSTQCNECAILNGVNALGEPYKVGYLLVGSTCTIPRCPSGNFFEWYSYLVNGQPSGQCYPCDTTCKECVGGDEDDCTLCPPGYQMQSNHTCLTCEQITGFYTNEQMQCQEICGDGLLFVLPCDDGNTKSGDGCSATCSIEYGYACPVPNTTCNWIIPPNLQKSSINGQNLIAVQFSTPIYVSSTDSISTDNLNVVITGRLASYVFKTRVLNPQMNVPGVPIQTFYLVLSDFQQTMLGSEQIQVSFIDSSQIQDVHGNALANGSYVQLQANKYTYINPNQLAATASGGSSLKYTFLSVFGFQAALKIILNSSMQFLWGLVHALQVFNYLLFININFPDNVQIFSNYLSISTGNFSDFEAYIPNAANYLVNLNDVIQPTDNDTIPPTFIQNGVSPYFIQAYGLQLTMWMVALFLILPSSILMNKLCKKVKLWEDIISAFFFNFPLRTFVEMYIQLIMQVILNTKVVKFSNYSQAMTTFIAFLFGVIALSLPFQAMNLIYANRKSVKRGTWKRKFGMLTEELRAKEILQLYYFPLFMYERLLICGIIVYGYDYPIIQCIMVMLCNALMITYLIVVRPFKDENQQVTTVIDEFVIMICVGMFIALYMETDPDKQTTYGWIIIFIIIASAIKNFAVVAYFGFQQAREQMRKMFQAEDEQIDSPSTSGHSTSSDGDVDTDEIMEDLQQDQRFQEWRRDVQTRRQERQNQMSSPVNRGDQSSRNLMQQQTSHPVYFEQSPDSRVLTFQ